MRIRIRWDRGAVEGILDDTPTAHKLAEVLPHTSEASTWGKEVFFNVPVQAELDANPKIVVPHGTVCFWVQGSCIALPFGPTPMSEGNESRLVTACNVLGRLEGDYSQLASVNPGDPITIESL